MSNHPADHAAQQVLSQFPVVRVHGLCRAVAKTGGFSGANVWCIETTPGSRFCLRAWPSGTELRHVAFSHRLMARARATQLEFVPCLFTAGNGQSALLHAGRIWELQQWVGGQADFRSQPTRSRLQAACTALARLHTAWGTAETTEGICPGVLRRLAAVSQWSTLVASGWRPREAMSRDDVLRPIAVCAFDILLSEIERAAVQLSAMQSVQPLQPCLRDPWHDHYLFEGDCLAGLIDYGSADIDHPSVDVARTLGSLVEDDEDAWQTGLAAYRAVRPFSAHDEAQAQILDHTGVVLAIAKWLMRLFHAREAVADRPALACRLERLVARLEKWQTV